MAHVLTKEEFYLLNSLYNSSKGRTPIFSDYYLNKAVEHTYVSNKLTALGYVDANFDIITPEGILALEPYRVSGAVILAAGPSSRCIPLSLELPKGLFEVKGEKLIERQIRQLREAGIEDITVVLGYKKEMFYYLREKYQIRFIENDAFLTRSNIYSLRLAAQYLPNAYICACDNYFVENPFNCFEYQTFNAGIHTDHKMYEMYVYKDEDERIVKMAEQQDKGYILLGHAYWNREFAEAFLSLTDNEELTCSYRNSYWEWLIKDHLDELPPFFYKHYASRAIVEFDYFSDLRRFDSAYVKSINSKIVKNIVSVFQCEESDILDFRKVSEGLTNISFIFKIKDIDYMYRHPGDGTDKIVNRRNERNTLELMKQWGIDPTYVYMDVEEGWKISTFVSEFREPDYSDLEDGKKVLKTLRNLHSLPIHAEYGLRPWEDAEAIERILEEKEPGCFAPYLGLKEKVGRLYSMTLDDGVEKCFCHGDTYRPNWMLKPDGSVILIDWEYSGYSDPGIDVGYYIVDAQYDFAQAETFVDEYLGDSKNEIRHFHFMAYIAIIAYYWFVWALYRESCGAVMGDALTDWRDMAVKYSDYLIN